MRKIYLLKFFLFSVFVFAQPKLFVGNSGTLRVNPGTLVYTGGGVKMVGTGKIDNGGNFYIKGNTADDNFITAATNADNTSTKTTGGNFILRLNDPANAATSTFGQLYITGIPQDRLTAIIDKEYKAAKHGTYQQMAFPFYNKTFNSLGQDLFGSNFGNIRYSKNEVLLYNNTTVVSENFNVTTPVTNPAGYYMVGTKNFDPSTKVYTVKGQPFSDESNILQTGIQLKDAGAAVVFGTYGEKTNQYKERYYSYMEDGFDYSTSYNIDTGAWTGNYGKNIYQFGNPFLTNIDLANIGINETASITDGNNLSNIQGIRFEVSGVMAGTTGSYSSGFKYITFNTSGAPTGGTSIDGLNTVAIGDINGLVIKPMETFVIKLKDNTAQPTLYFSKLRRFKSTPRSPSSDYTVTTASTKVKGFNLTAKTASTATSTSSATAKVRQLGVIALDKDGKELDRTYYVVYPNAKSGNNPSAKSQITAVNTNIIGTFEEKIEGGLDETAAQSYWLYINEANDVVSQGKEIPMYTYSDKIAKMKFEILEDAVEINKGQAELSNGESFYIKDVPANKLVRIVNGEILDVSTDEFGLYYGRPESATLDSKENIKPSLTRVVFDDNEKNFKVLFAPGWNTADIYIYDMSGRLISSENKVNANYVYTLKLNPSVNMAYIVKVISDQGEIVNRKIIR